MVTVLCSCQVADFDRWLPGYLGDVQMMGNLRSYRVWRGQDDPNLVTIMETFDSRDTAEAVMSSADVFEAMKRDGVDLASLQVQFLDEVAVGGS
jgi:quinol monooxygenase YgiN